MATLLENYYDRSNKFDSGMLTAAPGPADIWRQQELLYRIEVLEACQLFAKTAPQSTETGDLVWHFQMMDAYIQNLTIERRFGAKADETLQNRRNTSLVNLLRVIQDYRKRLGSFSPGNDAGFYRKTITSVIQAVLPAWIQYRQTYIEINKEAA
jgi:hypothetical protein